MNEKRRAFMTCIDQLLKRKSFRYYSGIIDREVTEVTVKRKRIAIYRTITQKIEIAKFDGRILSLFDATKFKRYFGFPPAEYDLICSTALKRFHNYEIPDEFWSHEPIFYPKTFGIPIGKDIFWCDYPFVLDVKAIKFELGAHICESLLKDSRFLYAEKNAITILAALSNLVTIPEEYKERVAEGVAALVLQARLGAAEGREMQYPRLSWRERSRKPTA